MASIPQDAAPQAAAGTWQLTAEVKPKAAEAAAPEPSVGVETSVAPPAWKESAEAVRTTVKWMVTAFAAVGAVLFAKGFITTPKLSWSENTWQLLSAWALGAVGISGIAWLVAQAVEMLRPNVLELGTLPAEFIAIVNAEPRKYLPADAQDVSAFRDKYQHHARAAENGALLVRRYERELELVKRQNPAEPTAVGLAEQQLAAARDGQKLLERNLSLYKKTRQQLVERAEYVDESGKLTVRTPAMVAAALLAAVGGIGYQLALASPDPDAAKKDAASQSPSIDLPAAGELVRSEGSAGNALWTAAGLEQCQSSPEAARVSVVVVAGNGSAADPYVVSTLRTETCPAVTFTVVSEAATVVVPSPIVITYSPSPVDTTN